MEQNIVLYRNIITDKNIYYAHLDTVRQTKETLKEHLNLTLKYEKKLWENKHWDDIFTKFQKKMFPELSEKGIRFFYHALHNVFFFHDVGKINPVFQSKKMSNYIGKVNNINFDSHHSFLSAFLYLDYFLTEAESFEKEEKEILTYLLILNAYVINQHHSGLNEFQFFLDKFSEEGDALQAFDFTENELQSAYFGKKYWKNEEETLVSFENMHNTVKNYRKESIREESAGWYFYVRMLLSMLVGCDYYATAEFMNGLEMTEFGDIHEISEFQSLYEETSIYKSIHAYENNPDSISSPMNRLRSDLFLETERELLNNLDKDIYKLEAPTGSGKSNMAINLSFRLMKENKELRKLWFVYPFNTLVEQNIAILESIFGKQADCMQKIAVINSIVPMKQMKKEGETESYEKSLLNRQFLNYPFILTTSVSLFQTMFGTKKEDIFGFHQLANSVVVLDEIQNYKNSIWTEMITFFHVFAQILNIKFIIMSATLPDLDLLINQPESMVRLVTERDKYFQNPLFKERVELSYELIGQDLNAVLNSVLEESQKKQKILIEFITKKSCGIFYDMLLEQAEKGRITCPVRIMNGDHNIAERAEILDEVHQEEAIILVSTQVIEAGVDIDMDVGYKDTSKLDSEEQFLGRINRSCSLSKKGKVYFMQIDQEQKIYEGDVRINKEFTLHNPVMQELLINKNFSDYYLPVLKLLSEIGERKNETNIEDFFEKTVKLLDFSEIQKRMTLIDSNEWEMDIYLCRRVKRKDGTWLEGKTVWDSYIWLLKDQKMGYAQKQIELSKVRSDMNYFIYQVSRKYRDAILYQDRVGELIMLEDGETFFENGRFLRERLETMGGGFI